MLLVNNFSCSGSHQCWRVLVRPEGLRDGPVTDGDTGFRVGSYVDQLVTTMPRLYTGLQHLSWSICVQSRGSWLHRKYKHEQLKTRRCLWKRKTTKWCWWTVRVCRQFKRKSGGLNSEIHQLFAKESSERIRKQWMSEWETAKKTSPNQTDAEQQLLKRPFEK